MKIQKVQKNKNIKLMFDLRIVFYTIVKLYI